MGLFNKWFGDSSNKARKEEKVLPWILLNNLQEITQIKKKSEFKTQVVFKHSTRCGISKMVLNQFVNAYNFTKDDFDLYYLDLLNYRDISNEVGYAFQVLHQSPQLIVIKKRTVVAHASHGAINSIVLENYL